MNATHTHNTSGIYQTQIEGNLIGFRFNGAAEAAKLISITSWGELVVDENSSNMFSGCVNLATGPTIGQPIFMAGATLAGMFRNTDFSSALSWDLTNVTSLDSMFLDTPFNLLNFSNTQGVASMASMFQRARKFNFPVSWNTSGVLNMSNLFAQTAAFNQLVTFETKSLISADRMFLKAVHSTSRLTLTPQTWFQQ